MIRQSIPRHRFRDNTRDDYRVIIEVYDVYGSNVANFDIPYTSFTHFETFYDAINPRDFVTHDVAPAAHLTIDKQSINGPISWYQGSSSSPQVAHATYTGPTLIKTASEYLNLGLLPSMPPGQLLEDHINAFNYFQNQVPETVSIPNFLFELKQVQDLIPKLSKNLPKMANDGFLNYSFGWKPLIGDLTTFRDLVRTLYQRIEFLQSTRGKPIRLYYKKKYREVPPVISEFAHEYICQRYDVTYNASCTLVQDLVGLDDAMTFWRALFGSTGFNNPAKVVWNALPFSFVLDWMLPVSDFLENLAVKPFLGRWDFFDLTTSVKEESKWVVNFQYPHPLNPKFRLGSIEFKRYRRSLGFPLKLDDIGFSGLSTNQQMLALSLLLSTTILRNKRKK